MSNEKNTYTYSYSAEQQHEVEKIRKKYVFAGTIDKMEKLRLLDKSVTKRGSIISVTVGTVSALIVGVGMCCTTLWTGYFILGIVIGIIGLIGTCAAYPIYSYVTKKERERLAPEIIALCDELRR